MARPEKGSSAWRSIFERLKEGVEKVVEIMSMQRGRLWAWIALLRAVLAILGSIAAFILSGLETGVYST